MALELDPESPWLAEAEAIAAATRANADLGYNDAFDFRIAQQEAFDGYVALTAGSVSASEPAPAAEAQPSLLRNVVEAAKRQITLFMKGFDPVPLAASAGAGVPAKFPSSQPLPEDWFDGAGVMLHFERDPSGAWYVRRTGTSQTLLLRLLSNTKELIGSPLRVGQVQAVLPHDLANLATIEVRVAGNHEPQD